jgi:hypothetical protein
MTPPEVAAYLRRWPARLRAELHGNLHQRMLDHHTFGLDEAGAWAAALYEFGPAPRRLGWPRPWLAGLLAMGLLGGSVYAAAHAAAHVPAGEYVAPAHHSARP